MKRTILIVFPIISIIFVFGCKKSGNEAMTIKIPLTGGVKNLDPLYAINKNSIWVVQQIYDPLVGITTDLQLVPRIAKRWEVDSSGTLYTFYTHLNIFFHNGNKLTIDDVIFSLERVCSSGSPYAWLLVGKIVGAKEFYDNKAPRVSGIIKINDSTFTIKLKEPFKPFLYLLALPACSIVPKDLLKMNKDTLANNPIGSGAFKLLNKDFANFVLLKRNDNYFREIPTNIQYVYFDLTPNELVNNIKFFKQEFDILPKVNKAYKELIRSNNLPEFVEARTTNELGVEFLSVLDSSGTVFDNKMFRKALSLSIDREELCLSLLYGEGKPAKYGFIPEGVPGLPKQRKVFYPYNIHRAKKIVDSLNISDNIELYCSPYRKDLADYLKNQFQTVGVKTKIIIREGSTLRQLAREGKIAFWDASWLADYPNVENFVALFYSKNKAPNGPNRSRFADSYMDKLYEKIKINPSHEVILEVESLIAEKLPVIPLYYYVSFLLINKDKVKSFPDVKISIYLPLEKVLLIQ